MKIDAGRLTYDEITKPHIIDAFYLADRQDEYVVDDVIDIWTGLFPCNWGAIATSHEERGVYVDGELWFFSSTSRKELGLRMQNGTRWIKGSDMLRNPGRWALRISPIMTDVEIAQEIDRANSLAGRRYDMVGVITDFMRPGLIFNQRNKIYCSKTCHFMHTGKMARISPKRRYKYVTRHGYRPVGISESL